MSYERGPIKNVESTNYGSGKNILDLKMEEATIAARDCLYELGDRRKTHGTFWHELRIRWLNPMIPKVVRKLCGGKAWRNQK